ncbi:hypothetical protein CKAN_00721200 [Cinnamomum micranthum f. kanehirae]|uniref:Uncharacterized protein n=1 Tax=Cinnamomum micranthum f. kanehirae TaxID=337451 RepID=A0A3S3P066_9MAGN|nr:hypothetical protein CKAN_00721200 [Cinnamomum micranthum f. kanehirae]
MRFLPSSWEVEKAIEITAGSARADFFFLWVVGVRGRKIQANITRFDSYGGKGEVIEKPRKSWKEAFQAEKQGFSGMEWSQVSDTFQAEKQGFSGMEWSQVSDTKKRLSIGRLKPKAAGWIVDDGLEKGVRVTPWVVNEHK